MKRYTTLMGGCCLLLLATAASAQTAEAPAAPPLSALTQEVNSLVMGLGESQIAFLQPFTVNGQRTWGESQLQAFRDKVVQATLRHPDVKSARAARRATQFVVRESWAPWYPQVSTQLSNGQISNDPSSILGTPERAYTSTSFNVTVRQLVYDFGATNSQIAGSNARDQQTLFKQYLSESDVAYRAIQSYHELVRASRQLELAKKNESARTSILDLVQQRYDIGGGTLSDVVRAQSRLAEAKGNTTSYQRTFGAVQASYREFFEGDVAAVAVDSPVFDVNAAGDWLSELGLAGQVSWKVRTSQAAVVAAEADLKNTQAKSFASINVELSSTRRDWVAPGVPGTDQSVALVARQSLYTGGADSARIAQSVQKLQQSQEELNSAQLEYKRMIDQLILEVEYTDQLVQTRQSTAILAAESLRMIREQYAYRRGTLLDLLTAQETLYFAGRDLIDVQIDKALSTYKLLSQAALLNQFVGLSIN